MLEPARGVGREVRVVGEDLLGRHDLLDLHEQALAADARMERIAGLVAGLELIACEVRVRERLGPEVEQRLPELSSTGSAGDHASSSYAVIWASVRLRASSPSAWAAYQSAVQAIASSRPRRGFQ